MIQVVQHVNEAEKYEQPTVTLITFPLVSEDDGFYTNFGNIGQNFMGFLLEPYHKHSSTFIHCIGHERENPNFTELAFPLFPVEKPPPELQN